MKNLIGCVAWRFRQTAERNDLLLSPDCIIQAVDCLQCKKENGEPGRIRTFDPLIKSQLLYHLSYGPTKGFSVLAIYWVSPG